MPFVSVILWGGNHDTMAVDVLRDTCVTFTRVRFSGFASTGKVKAKYNHVPNGQLLDYLLKRTWMSHSCGDFMQWEGKNYVIRLPLPVIIRMLHIADICFLLNPWTPVTPAQNRP